MMREGKHVIRNFNFEIECDSEKIALDLQRRISAILHERLLPAIDKIFTAASLKEHLIRIKNIDLDLGEVDYNNLDETLESLLISKLKDELARILFNLKTSPLPQDGQEVITSTGADIEIIIHFLETGTLPWWASNYNTPSFSLSNLLEKIMDENPKQLASSLPGLLKQSQIKKRFLYQIELPLIEKLIKRLFPTLFTFWDSFQKDIEVIQAKSPSHILTKNLRIKLLEEVFENSVNLSDIRNESETLQKLVNIVRNNFSTQQYEITKALSKAIKEIPKESFKTALPEVIQKVIKDFNKTDISEYWQISSEKDKITYLQDLNDRQYSSVLEKMVSKHDQLLITEVEKQLLGAIKLTKVNTKKLKELIRKIVLDYLIASPSTSVSKEKIYIQLIQNIGSSLNVTPFELVNQIQKEAPVKELIPFEKQLKQDEAKRNNKDWEPDTSSLLRELSDKEIIRNFFLFGVIPWTARNRFPDFKSFEVFVEDLIQQKPSQLKQVLEEVNIKQNAPVIRRIQEQFKPAIASVLLEGIPAVVLAFISTPPPKLENLRQKPDLLIDYIETELSRNETSQAPQPFSIEEVVNILMNDFPLQAKAFIQSLPEQKVKKLASIIDKKSAKKVDQLKSEDQTYFSAELEKALSNYLETGKLDFKVKALQENTINYWVREFVENHPTKAYRQLVRHYRNKNIVKKWIEILNEENLSLLANLISPSQFHSLFSLAEKLTMAITTGSTTGYGEKQLLWETIFTSLATNHGKIEDKDVLIVMLTIVVDEAIALTQIENIVKVTSLSKEAKIEAENIIQQLKENKTLKEAIFQKDKSKKIEENSERKFREPILKDPTYLNNSGLIILHPFLSRFFNMMGLLEKRAFKNRDAQFKAAHLLQYLANKTTYTSEHEMALNKVLCGIPLGIPLAKEIEITEEEQNTCESLLKGVIQNWTILKNSTPDNLRSSFLMREGALYYDGMQWTLKVEQKGLDVLLDKIPWSINTVKLPWMDKTLFVQWR